MSALCGCFDPCNCLLEAGPPDLLQVTQGNGDLLNPWILTAYETVFAASNTDGAIDIVTNGPYGHEPVFNLVLDPASTAIVSTSLANGLRIDQFIASVADTDSIDLTMTGNQLTADVRIDGASPTPISITPNGLSIGTVPPISGGVPTGTVIDYLGTTAPSGFLMGYGQLENPATYPTLFSLLGTTYGGDGITTFGIPDFRGRVGVGLDNMGGVDAGRLPVANTLGFTGGDWKNNLTVTNLPAHTHTATDSGHTHPISDPGHIHLPGTPSRSFVTVDAGFTNRDVNEATSGTPPNTRYVAGSSGGATVQPLTINETTSIPQQGGSQQNNAQTSLAGTGVSVSSGSANVSVSGGGNGTASGSDLSILQPYMLVNKIIKT